jgi:hypothetical protein
MKMSQADVSYEGLCLYCACEVRDGSDYTILRIIQKDNYTIYITKEYTAGNDDDKNKGIVCAYVFFNNTTDKFYIYCIEELLGSKIKENSNNPKDYFSYRLNSKDFIESALIISREIIIGNRKIILEKTIRPTTYKLSDFVENEEELYEIIKKFQQYKNT